MPDLTTDPTLDPTKNPDAQEALSIKYGNGGVVVVPLSSGALAIFDRSFALHQIIDDPTSGMFAQLSLVFKTSLMSKTHEARYLGEPDDHTYKKDRIKAYRLETRPDKAGLDVSDFEF